jgi:hypothetical protein
VLAGIEIVFEIGALAKDVETMVAACQSNQVLHGAGHRGPDKGRYRNFQCGDQAALEIIHAARSDNCR